MSSKSPFTDTSKRLAPPQTGSRSPFGASRLKGHGVSYRGRVECPLGRKCQLTIVSMDPYFVECSSEQARECRHIFLFRGSSFCRALAITAKATK